jgi:hypothetical protein
MKEAGQPIDDLLRQRHHIQPGGDPDFTVRNLEEVFVAQKIRRAPFILLGFFFCLCIAHFSPFQHRFNQPVRLVHRDEDLVWIVQAEWRKVHQQAMFVGHR